MAKRRLTSVEYCAGAGGQALGLEGAGFKHLLLVDNDPDCCRTLQANRPKWRVECADMNAHPGEDLPHVDLFAAGLPCPPFSIAGKQLGARDERNLFPAALRLIAQTNPRFVLIENVRGFLSKSFAAYREELRAAFADLGYTIDWRLLNASDYGVSQSRARVAIVAARPDDWAHFAFPEPQKKPAPTVAKLLGDLMGADGWHGLPKWLETATAVAPTIVGGSKKHGGPDLGPTRARAAWKKLGVNGSSIAEHPPTADHEGLPRLTVRMVARVQGFPDDWAFTGRKTAAYRQVGNAFPPPVAKALGQAIKRAIHAADSAETTRKAAE